MRKFRVYYYKEVNDECVDYELDIESKHISNIYEDFQEKVRVFKRVYRIEEISNK